MPLALFRLNNDAIEMIGGEQFEDPQQLLTWPSITIQWSLV